jgi:TonB family protein
MRSNPEHNTFLPSGCLAQNTMKRYLAGNLSLSEKEVADEHLMQCALCRDAMEGYGMVPDHALTEKKIAQINQNLKDTFRKGTPGNQPRMTGMNKRFFYLSAAAAVIILLGLYFILQQKLPSNSDLLTTTDHMDTEEIYVPPKPVVEEQPVEDPMDVPKPVSEKKETPEMDLSESLNELQSTQKIEFTPPQQGHPVKEQIKNIPESISQSNPIRQTLFENDQDESVVEAFEQGIDIASAGPIEYFLSGVTFFNELPDMKASGEEETVDSYNVGTLTKTSRRNVTGQTKATAMELPEITPEAEHMEMEQVVDSAGLQDHFFVLVDQMPQFPGGSDALANYLQTTLRYPDGALKGGFEGTVSISFIIEENGQVSSVKVNHGPGQGLDEETIRVISEMPPWIPALHDGRPVRSFLTMPVTFRLR